MFHTNEFHTHNTAAPYPQEVNHHYKNPTPGESIRLLKEMQKEALDSILQTYQTENTINSITVTCSPTAIGTAFVGFRLNGEHYTVELTEFEIGQNSGHPLAKHRAMLISRIVAKKVAMEVHSRILKAFEPN